MSSTNLNTTTNLVTANDYPVACATGPACTDVCSVCLDPLAEGEARTIPCNHTFHTTCLQRILDFNEGGDHANCGICRRQISRPIKYEKFPRFKAMIDRIGGTHKAYQYEGLEWCVGEEKKERGGGLIADDMGLGKTFTIVGTMIENFKRNTLIIVPIALIEQWYQQIHSLTGHKALVYHGYGRKKYTDDQLRKAPVVISTYGEASISLRPNRRDKLSALHRITWNRIVFDEAHHLRNSNTGRHHGAAKLSASIKWLVTGTPIQNCKRDFLSLCNIINVLPDKLQNEQMIRRSKDQVGLGLPALVEHTLEVSWNNVQEQQLAEEIHASMTNNNVRPAFGGSISSILSEWKIVDIVRAKQVCTMPSAFNKVIAQAIENGHIETEHAALQGSIGTSKISAVVDKIMERKNNNTKKLVFCTYHNEIDFVASSLRNHGIRVKVKDGRKENSRVENPEVMVLQIQTCCEGLNLQEFSEIYFVTPHWNPFVEKQAIGRCHRFGQIRCVEVFRFYMQSNTFRTAFESQERVPYTFDQLVVQKQELKTLLAELVLEQAPLWRNAEVA